VPSGVQRAEGAAVLERLSEEPGGRELLEVAGTRGGIALVGGAVRDLLLGGRPRELDVVVAGDAPALAHALAARLPGAQVQLHERFGTALVVGPCVRIDVATRRAESYPAPGALPEVRAGTLEEDLLRRDFTANAIAVVLSGAATGESGTVRHAPHDPRKGRGTMHAAPHALEDLRAGRLRVLHERSFLDDPTRLLRLARYRVRLGFALEPSTAELACEAVSAGALATLSGARLGAELRLALAEDRAPAVLEALGESGVLAAIHPRVRFEPALAARAVELLPHDADRRALLLAVMILPLFVRADGAPQSEALALLDRLELPQAERDLALVTAGSLPRLVDELPRRTRPSELYALATAVPLQALALAGALDADLAPVAQRWLQETRHVRLQITGVDLLAAGVPEGPEVGRRLQAALRARLDGELADGREAELRCALET
jgi:tRNA nucleotidyltransferase (CCA-adding enzyme)